MKENKVAGKSGGGIARKARVELEEKTGRSVVTGDSFLPLKMVKVIEKKGEQVAQKKCKRKPMDG